MTLLFNPDRVLYGTAQLTGFAGILLTLYLANLGVEVVLRRRFQIAGMLALLAAWVDFINSSGSEAHWLLLLALALPFHGLGLLVLVRGIRPSAARKADKPPKLLQIMTARSAHPPLSQGQTLNCW